MRSLLSIGLLTLAACVRDPGPASPADDTDPVGETDTSSGTETDAAPDSDIGSDTDTGGDTDEETDPAGWEWGADNDPADADASLVGEWGDMAGVCLLGVPDADGNGADDLLVGAPYHDEHRGRVFLVAGASGWTLEMPLDARPQVRGETVWDELCTGVPGDFDADGVTDVLFDTGYNASAPAGRFPLVRGGTWSVPTTPEARVDDTSGGQTLFADLAYRIGDVDGDGLDDAWFWNAYDGGGQAMIVPGSALHGDVNGPDVAMLWVAAEAGRRTQFSQQTGDVDGDGRADLLAWYVDEDPLYAAMIVPGRNVGGVSAPIALAEPPTKTIACADECVAYVVGDIDADGWPDALELGDADHRGVGVNELVPVGDVNGDGVGDFAQVSAGPTYGSDLLVWFGGGTWPAVLDAGGADVVIAGLAQPDGIWRDPSGRVPDLNGDGLADLVLGNGGVSVGSNAMAGALSVFVGRDVWPATLTAADADVRFVGSAADAWMGMFLYGLWTAIADLDGDGRDDVVALDRYGDTAVFFGKDGP